MGNEIYAKWKGESFECQRCGSCCYRQNLIVSTAEIKAILAHLKTKNSGQFEQFIRDCCTCTGRLIEYDKKLEAQYRNTLFNFYMPFGLECFEEATLVHNHIIHFYPTTKRCVFHNPLETSCFIYPARPLLCKFYPFVVAENINDINYEKSCPGMGHGSPPNERKLHETIETYGQLIGEDIKLVVKYVADKKLKPIKKDLIKESGLTNLEQRLDKLLASRFKEEKADSKESFPEYYRKLIDPYVELKIIPSSIPIEIMKKAFDFQISQRNKVK